MDFFAPVISASIAGKRASPLTSGCIGCWHERRSTTHRRRLACASDFPPSCWCFGRRGRRESGLLWSWCTPSRTSRRRMRGDAEHSKAPPLIHGHEPHIRSKACGAGVTFVTQADRRLRRGKKSKPATRCGQNREFPSSQFIGDEVASDIFPPAHGARSARAIPTVVSDRQAEVPAPSERRGAS